MLLLPQERREARGAGRPPGCGQGVGGLHVHGVVGRPSPPDSGAAGRGAGTGHDGRG